MHFTNIAHKIKTGMHTPDLKKHRPIACCDAETAVTHLHIV